MGHHGVGDVKMSMGHHGVGDVRMSMGTMVSVM
jgi:hypothetical protein